MRKIATRLLWSTALTLALPTLAEANPQNGQVSAGSATIVQTSPQNLTVNQGSQKVVINWQSFSIGSGETTTFNQPGASAIALNRVVGADPSSILGNLNANGQVWLVNPNGIAFGRSARVDVAGLLATTIDIADRDFMGGTYRFSGLKNPSAMVSNAGLITVRDAGLAALVAPGVENSGVIQANLGQIQLSSAAAFTVDLYGDGLFNFTLDKQVSQAIHRQDGTKPTAAVSNTGVLIAAGGRILLTANAASSVVSNAINMSGYAQATSASVSQNGEIVLDGGSEGTVQVAGTLDASGTGTGQNGGSVHVTGQNVQLASTARIDVSGDAGGGTALVGGDRHGGGTLPHAATTTVASGATINADAVSKGNGGEVVVWSDQQTNYQGTISARGGTTGGNGGSAEVSSHGLLNFNGLVDLRAPHGVTGSLLLDPENVTIASNGDTPSLPSSPTAPIAFNPTVDNSVLSVSTLQSALALADVTVSNGSTGSQAGDITVAANVSWGSGNTLTLSAYRNITINDGVTIANTGAGSLNLHADNTGTGVGTVTFNGTGKVDFSGSTGLVSIFYNPADNPSGGVVNTTSYTSPTDFSSHVLTNSTVPGQLTAYMLVNSVNDLQDVQNNLTVAYALGRDIDASETVSWNGGAGFTPLATNVAPFTGIFDGQGHVVDSLTVTSVGDSSGLFGWIGTGGVVRDLGITNVTATGNGAAAFAIENAGTISNSYVTGSVQGPGASGLVYINAGTVEGSHSDASVTGSGDSIGGLVGNNFSGATIVNSYATGTVHAGCCGGSAGEVGGLVGTNDGTITQSYATGAVSGGDNHSGGLVGINDTGSIFLSYATGPVSGSGVLGGLVGSNYSGTISESYATGLITNTCVMCSAWLGGLVGYTYSGTVTSSYWDIDTSGQAGSVGGTGLTTAQFMSSSSFSTWNFTKDWVIVDTDGTLNNSGGANGATRPFLRSEYSATITNAHQLQLMALDLSANYTLGNNVDMSEVTQPSGLWASGAGFVPVGGTSASFGGTLNGNGYTISNLFENSTGTYFGLFGEIGSTGVVQNVGLTNENIVLPAPSCYCVISGGGLVFDNHGTISNVSTAGTIDAGTATSVALGGLAAQNEGTISQSHSSVAITADSSQLVSSEIGGLAAYNNGVVTASYAIGAITAGSGYFGGLVGYNDNNGTITYSNASGSVTSSAAGASAGGLVGGNYGAIGQSYATGDVSGSGYSNPSYYPGYLGGLVGFDGNHNVGGDGAITQSYASGSVTGSGTTFGGGLVGATSLQPAIAQTYAIGSVSGDAGSTNGGLIGYLNGTLTYSYWNAATSGQSVAVGAASSETISNVSNLTTAQFQSGSLPAGFDPSVWIATVGQYPTLKQSVAVNSPTIPIIVNFGSAGSIPVTWSVANATSTYGSLATLGTATLNGVAASDKNNVGYTLGLFLNLNGTDPITLSSALDAGTYYEWVTGLTGSAVGSYTLSPTGSYGVLTIDPATLTYVAKTTGRVYGDSNPDFGGTVTGFVLGQDLSGATTGTLSFTSTATTTSNVGSYAITGSGLTADNGNYTFVQAPGNAVALTVSARSITVTADNLSRIVGAANPPLTWTVTSGSFVNNDMPTGALMTAATLSSLPIPNGYPITIGTLSASHNYALNFIPGTLTIYAPAQLTSFVAQTSNPRDTLTYSFFTIKNQASKTQTYSVDEATIGGYTFAPLSQQDANAYLTSSGALADWPHTCLAIVYTMIARALGDKSATASQFWSADGAIPGELASMISPPIGQKPNPFNGAAVVKALESGMPTIIGGTITNPPEDHFMLATGVDSNGNIIANDPWTGGQVTISQTGSIVEPKNYPALGFSAVSYRTVSPTPLGG